MKRFFALDYAARGNIFESRMIGPADPEAASRFLGRLREEGARALKDFPSFEWYPDNGPARQPLDVVPGHWLGIFISERAHAAVRQYAPELSAEVVVGGQWLHWYSLVPANGNRTRIDGEPPASAHLLMLMPLGITVCSEAFVHSWARAGLTGATFTAIG